MISRAIQILGTQKALAEAVGVTPQCVSQWVSGGRPIPPTRCRAIEAATGGKVTAHELRPDVFGVQQVRVKTPGSEGATEAEV